MDYKNIYLSHIKHILGVEIHIKGEASQAFMQIG